MKKTARIILQLALVSIAAPFTAAAASQTINFDAIPNQIFGVSPFVITAQVKSGLPVSFTATTPGVCKLAGSLVTLLSVGPCFITASQAGNGTYSAAMPVTQGFTVSQAKPAGTLTAAPGGSFGLNATGLALATADFNGDGIPDIAVANDSEITFALGDGKGGFTLDTTYSATMAQQYDRIVAGDFNGDGFADVAVLNVLTNGNVLVLLGNGAGGFTAAPGGPFPVGAYPFQFAVGDFNGDGIEDLVVTSFQKDVPVTVLLGNGAGGFSAASGSPISAGSEPVSLAVADFNGDGNQDLAVANNDVSGITILLGNGSGGFTGAAGNPYSTGSFPRSIVAGDFNRDGNADLAVSNGLSNNVTVLLGNGIGGFIAATGSPFAVGAVPNSLTVGDFNGDGIQDLATGNAGDGDVTVLIGDGTGGFRSAGTVADAIVVFAGDFNNDGVQDLAVISVNQFNVTVLLGGLAPSASLLSTTSPSSILPGQAMGLTLAVSDTGTAFSTPTGSVTIMDGTTVLGTASQNASPYTFSASGLSSGSHTLTAVYGGDARTAGSTSNAVVIQVELAQTISFGALSNVTLGSGNVTLTATVSSGLAISYASTTQGVCTVSGSSVTPVGFGTCSITASQAGNSAYVAATPVTQTFIVSPVTPAVTSVAPNTAAAFSAAIAVTIAGSNFVSGATVLFTPPGGVAQTIAPSLIQAAQLMATVPASFLTTAGTAQVAVNNGFSALSNAVAFTITAATQTIAFDAIPNQILGVSPFAIAAQASSGLPVSFTSSTVAVCTTVANLVIMRSAGTCSIAANSNAATPAVRSFAVNAAEASGNFAAAPGSPFAVEIPALAVRSNPYSVAVGDFNGDGIQDLVAPLLTEQKIVVWLGDGKGGFTLAAGSPFAVGAGPDSAAVGDFNNDGFQDIAVANMKDNTVTILLGNGAGGFAAATGSPFAAGTTPFGVTVGDFNGDGIQDLVMANQSSNAVTVLLGNGLGGFVPASGSPFAVGTYPWSVTAGDFNGDGFQDLATANINSNDITVLLGDGAGGFTQATGSPYLSGPKAGPSFVAVGDFNGDGIQDLAAANYGSASVTVLLGNMSGTLTVAPGGPFMTGGQPESLAVGDFNGDGIQDLATANVFDSTVTLLLGDGMGGFTAAVESPLPAGGMTPAGIVAGDFNGDRIQDLAVANFNSGSVTVLLGIALGHTPQTISFGPQSEVVWGTPYTLSATASSGLTVTFTASGVCTVAGNTLTPKSFGPCTVTAHQTGDAAYAAAASVTQVLFIHDPQTISFGALSDQVLGSAPVTLTATATSGLPVSFASTTPGVCSVTGNVATLTGAGKCSITASQPGNAFFAAATPVVQAFNVTVVTPVSTSISPNTVAAFSGPTAVTIAGSNFVSGAQISFTPPGGTTQTITPSLVQAAQLMATIPAAFLTTAGTAQVSVTNGFTAFSNQVAFTITPARQTMSFDAIPNQILGGSPFVIAAKASSGLPVGFASTTPAVCKVAANQVLLVTTGTCSITATQSGNAGYAAVSATRTLVVSQAKPSGTLTQAGSPYSTGGTSEPASAAVGDFNGDGIQDIAVANINSGDITVLLGNGAGGFVPSPGSPFQAGLAPVGIRIGDFNDDGIQDLVVANFGGSSFAPSNTATVLLGNGAGEFAAEGPLTVGSDPTGVAVGDFNGDGIQDLAVTNAGSNITILLGNGSGGFAASPNSPLTTGQRPGSIVVGDFNRDGILDIATANINDDNVTVLLGSRSGGFTAAIGSPYVTAAFPVSLIVGDFNRDGIPDLATANTNGNNVTVLLGDGSGRFIDAPGGPFVTGQAPSSLVAGDFNGDGVPDLATANAAGQNITVLLGTGIGGFITSGNAYPLKLEPNAVAAGDFNGDGLLDVAVTNVGSNNVTVMLGGLARTESALSATSATTIAAGQPVTLSLAVSDTTPAFAAPTGLVTFSDGTTVLGTASQAPYIFVASGLALGTHTITATYSGDLRSSGSVSNALVIQVELPQTITFGPLPNVPVGTAAFALSAMSDSGLAVSFASSTPIACSVTGNMVTILGSGGCAITASQGGDSTYAAAAPVTQKFTVFFSDVSPGDSDYAAINAMAQHGITAGCAANSYCPNLNVTRDEMAIFIVRAIYGSDNFTYTTTPYFTDVTPTTFGFKWIQKLKDLGITNGCGVTTYCPGAVVARDQMAVFIIRARLGLGIAGPNPTFSYPSTPYFTDAVAGSEFAFPWIQRMKLDRITNGCAVSSYCPNDAVTRGEMAIFIMRGAFNQFLPAGTPVISQISPATLARGASGTFTVTGVNTNFVQGTTVVSPIPGVTIGAVTVTSPTSLTVQLSAASNAIAQPYSVLAITGSEEDVLPNGLALQ